MCVESSKLPAAETDSPRYGRFAVLDPTYRSRKCRERGRKKLGEFEFQPLHDHHVAVQLLAFGVPGALITTVSGVRRSQVVAKA